MRMAKFNFVSRAATTAFAVSVLSMAVLSGCATPPAADDDDDTRAEWTQRNDPFEPMNRDIFAFNMAVDHALLKPVAVAYRDYVPQYGRDRVHDLVENWRSPMIFANDVLQGDPDRAVATLMRFAFNTGFGALGLFDLAGSGIPFHETDLGSTFAVWGVGEGPYLVLPVLGPSNPRDTVGMAIEWVVDPVDYRLDAVYGVWAPLARGTIAGIDLREANLDGLDEVERTAIDLYSTIRSLYRQHREAEIRHEPDLTPSPGLTTVPTTGPEISQETR